MDKIGRLSFRAILMRNILKMDLWGFCLQNFSVW